MGEKLSDLSVFIIAKDEERHIQECVQSASFAAEVIVVDSGSSDRTAEIANQSGAIVIKHRFSDFASQKNFALQQTGREWVLSLDADERITAELREEIKRVIQDDTSNAFYIKRVSYIFSKRFNYSGTQHDYPMRLFRRSVGKFEQAIHEVVRIKGSTQRIHSPILHYTLQRVKDYLRRLNFYTDLEATSNKALKPIGSDLIAVKSIGRFLDIYLRKRGIFDKAEGFIFAVLSAWYEWVKQFKIWEAQQFNDGK